MDRTAVTIALCALLVLAGCSASSPGGDAGGTTTAPTTTETVPGFLAGDIYRGVAVETSAALTHANNFTVVARSNTTRLGGSGTPTSWRRNQTRVIRIDKTTRAIAIDTRLTNQDGSVVRRSRFVYNGTRYARYRSADNVTYRATAAPAFQPLASRFANVTGDLELYDLSYAGTTTFEGRQVHVITGHNYSAGHVLFANISNATTRAYVAQTGRLLSLEQQYTGTVGTQSGGEIRVRLRTHFRVRGLNSTSVGLPQWVNQRWGG
ncbi:MAG: hypothetical protein ABEJ42_03150 [Halobacteriaceae archaeon]